MFLYSKCGIEANTFGIAFKSIHGVSFSIDLYLPFYKSLILRTANHQQAASPAKYRASVRQVGPYEISTQCAHSNEKCIRGEKKSRANCHKIDGHWNCSEDIPLQQVSAVSNGYLIPHRLWSLSRWCAWLLTCLLRSQCFCFVIQDKSLATVKYFLFCAWWSVKTIYFLHWGSYLFV